MGEGEARGLLAARQTMLPPEAKNWPAMLPTPICVNCMGMQEKMVGHKVGCMVLMCCDADARTHTHTIYTSTLEK